MSMTSALIGHHTPQTGGDTLLDVSVCLLCGPQHGNISACAGWSSVDPDTGAGEDHRHGPLPVDVVRLIPDGRHRDERQDKLRAARETVDALPDTASSQQVAEALVRFGRTLRDVA